ncbi:MAG: HVO_2922 family protein [Halobacteriales archaeon]|nr:HVO_2922 family protein [Halobacteriales archaeon]
MLKFELYKDKADEWRWRLRHRNGNIMADSGEGYARKTDAKNAIETLREEVGDAEVEEL